MGCTAAKPAPPLVATYDGPSLPQKKRSTALFSRGESQLDEIDDLLTDENGVPAERQRTSPAPAAAADSKMAEVAIPLRNSVRFEEPLKLSDANEAKGQEAGTTTPEATTPVVLVEEDRSSVSADIAVSLTDASYETKSTPTPPPKQQSPVAPSMLPGNAMEEEKPPMNSVDERLRKVEAVIYPSAEAALASRGLRKYAAELQQKGVVSYRDLANLAEDMDDPFWSKMPPFPDRKKMRGVIEEARMAYDLSPEEVAQPAIAASETVTPYQENGQEEVQESSIRDETAVPVEKPVVNVESHDQSAEQAEETPKPRVPPAPPKRGVKSEETVQDVAEGEVESPEPPSPPRQKQATPCDDYETDIYAADFGMCLCGHPKKVHNLGAMSKTPSYAQRQVAATKVETPVVQDGSVCSNYRIDMTAPKFGTCMCGNPKASHSAQSEGPSNKFKAMPKGSFNANSPMVTRQSSSSSVGDGKVLPPTPMAPLPSPIIEVVQQEKLPDSPTTTTKAVTETVDANFKVEHGADKVENQAAKDSNVQENAETEEESDHAPDDEDTSKRLVSILSTDSIL